MGTWVLAIISILVIGGLIAINVSSGGGVSQKELSDALAPDDSPSDDANDEGMMQSDGTDSNIRIEHNRAPGLCLEDTYFYQVKPDWDPNMLLLRCKKCDKNIAFIWFKPDPVDGTLEITPVDDAYADEKYQSILQAKLLERIPNAYEKDPVRARGYQQIQKELQSDMQQTTANAPVAATYRQQPIHEPQIRCPVCRSTAVRKIDGLEHVAFYEWLGIASPLIGKCYECKSCGHFW